MSLETGGILERAGVLVGFHTDDPITDSRLLNRSAALGVRAGMSRKGALEALTINGAKILDLDKRIGSLEVGKDADVVLWSGILSRSIPKYWRPGSTERWCSTAPIPRIASGPRGLRRGARPRHRGLLRSRRGGPMRRALELAAVLLGFAAAAPAQVAIHGQTVHTMAGEPIRDGIVVIRDGKIAAVGPAATTKVPEGFKVLEADVVTPGLIDAHTVVGLTGYLNQAHDQEQVEKSAPIQPELRAIDAYDPDERLVEWIRGFGITTIHTGHGPLALVSGQTMIAKTWGKTPEEAAIVPLAMVAATLGDSAIDKTPAPARRRSRCCARSC